MSEWLDKIRALGASICKEIMDQHGGQITVKSQLGQGSSFTLWLQPA
jgi:signal transduction histidine kinase